MQQTGYCWQCKDDVDREEVVILKDGDTIYAELCYHCYESDREKF